MRSWARHDGRANYLVREVSGEVSSPIGAVGNRYPHVFAPLSAGKVGNDHILFCGCHGLGFDRSGTSPLISYGAVLRGSKIGSWRLAEHYSDIPIWMGDLEYCRRGLSPSISWFDETLTAHSRGEIPSGGGYGLYVDDIRDLSHTDYLHADTFGQGSVEFNSRMSV